MTKVETGAGTRFRKWFRVSSLIFLGASMASHILLVIYEILGSRYFRVEGLSEMALGPRLVDRFPAMFAALLNAACFYALSTVFNPLIGRIRQWAQKAPTSKSGLGDAGLLILIVGGITFIGLLSIIVRQWINAEWVLFPHDRWIYPVFGFFYLFRETSYFACLGLLFLAIARAGGHVSLRPGMEGS